MLKGWWVITTQAMRPKVVICTLGVPVQALLQAWPMVGDAFAASHRQLLAALVSSSSDDGVTGGGATLERGSLLIHLDFPSMEAVRPKAQQVPAAA